MFKAVSKIVVRYCETDMMKIVHHSNYFPWFEIGRGDYFKFSGMSYRDVEECGIMLPLIEANCKYLIPASYDDELELTTYIEELSGARVKFCYEVKKGETNIAKGYTLHAFVNSSFKVVNLKKSNKEIWEKLSSLYEEK